jgi:hypothetical protein
MSPSPAPASVAVSASPLTVYHRGFVVALRRMHGRFGRGSYGFAIRHLGLLLHESAGLYGSASSAACAARVFVDDALGAFDRAHVGLEAGA